MPTRRANPQRVKMHRSYSVPELATRLSVHKNTVRHWQRNGLEPIEASRPWLFQGGAVRAFLAKRYASRKRPCSPGTIFCFRCRAPRPPALGMLDYIAATPISGNLRAMCEVCGGMMHRRIRRADLAAKMPGLAVHFRQAPSRLGGSFSPSENCDSERQVTP
ncbi:MAG TPA: helix-turn-helix domain-containing protein [Novosphingobium sp.]|nr:helix-turn-helix domain-containing protein [Novosphingobium sp.]